jgi:multiple sugar transport system permease protein
MMIDATVAPKVGFISPFGTTVCNVNHINGNEFFFAPIFTSTYASKTVPMAPAEFIGRHSVNWRMRVTGGFIASLPPIILSLAFYRYVEAGLSAGGLKE